MKPGKKILLIGLLGMFATACNLGHPLGIGPVGGIYTSNKIGISGNTLIDRYTMRQSQACTQRISVSYIQFAWGEGAISDLFKFSGQKTIHAIDKETMSILGVYGKLCTIVYWSEAK